MHFECFWPCRSLPKSRRAAVTTTEPFYGNLFSRLFSVKSRAAEGGRGCAFHPQNFLGRFSFISNAPCSARPQKKRLKKGIQQRGYPHSPSSSLETLPFQMSSRDIVKWCQQAFNYLSPGRQVHFKCSWAGRAFISNAFQLHSDALLFHFECISNAFGLVAFSLKVHFKCLWLVPHASRKHCKCFLLGHLLFEGAL